MAMTEHDGAAEDRTGLEVAVVGLAGRFPGAADIHAFWRNLREGVESVRFFTRETLLAAGHSPALLDDPHFVPAASQVAGADEMDAAFFGISPRDAEILNPQHRMFLECAWAALEHAGYDPARVEWPVGVFAGSGLNTYLDRVLARDDLVRAVGRTRIILSNDKDHMATGTAYRLNLRGPAMAVQTACSTSLVAVHVACQSLINGECDMALAGGAAIFNRSPTGYLYSPDGIASPDGHCHAFDAGARGTISGSGAGVVALRRLEDAIADGDTIHAVIRGSAVNNDGAQKVGYTAPSVTGQARVIREALSVAGVDAATVQYLETHGSGTQLGDAIELKALGEVLSRAGDGPPWAIGSVKTNVGHMDSAAGVTGLIKTVLALSHQEIPPSLNCEVPHPEIQASGGRVFVNTVLRPWTRNGTPRRAGVSSFGIGGTNAHMVLEEAPAPEPPGHSRAFQLLVLSARTPTALATAAETLAAHLEAEPPPLADAAFTLQTGRAQMEHRLAVVCADPAEGAERLREAAARGPAAVPRSERPVAFLFPGVGMQYVNMGRGLYDAEPAFRAAVDECCEILRPLVGSDLRDVLFSTAGTPDDGSDDAGDPASAKKEKGGWNLRRLLGREPKDDPSPLDDTRIAQPAVFVIEYALATLWMSWGVRPSALAGHSLGEYVAACVAGVLTLDDALRLVGTRARLIDELPGGAMLAVPLGEAALREILPAELDVAAVNTPESCVVAGPVEEIEAFEAALAERGTLSRRLPAGHAFHSRAMAAAAEQLERLVAGFDLRAPEIPFVSNVTGTWITDDEARSPEYWTRHLCRTVRFADGVATLRQEPGRALLEVGPGQALGAWAMQHPAGGEPGAQVVLSSLRHQHNHVPDLRFLLESLARLWAAGVAVDWAAFRGDERRRRIPLPGYPFERQQYWVDPLPAAVADVSAATIDTRSADAYAAETEQKGPDMTDDRQAAARAAEIAASPREQALLGVLKRIVAELTGIGEEYVSAGEDLFQLGFDSLLLLQAIQAIEKRVGVRVSLIDLLEDIATLGALAAHLDRVLPPGAEIEGVTNGTSDVAPAAIACAIPPSTAAVSTSPVAPPAADAQAAEPRTISAPPAFYPAPPAVQPGMLSGDGTLERLFAQQLQAMNHLMAQQIAAVTGAAPASPAANVAGVAHSAALAPIPSAVQGADGAATSLPATSLPAGRVQVHAVEQAPRARIQPETFVPYQVVNPEGRGGMTPRQREYLEGFIARYVEKTKGSKAHQVRYHLPLADTRVSARFRRAWKEILYPIVSRRALGSRVWDVDGNEYVDTGMSYGCNLFGHAPEFVSAAIRDQVERGYGVGPQSPHAGRAAELICELGGNDRAVFCNSGTEAVMGAIRAARTFSARNKIAVFSGSYHGWADVVLGRLTTGQKRELRPTGPGVSPAPLQDVMMLEWDDPASLEVLARHMDELAVVMVEPVQSRRLDIHPRAFLHELRRITAEAGVLLHFDELITGFRVAPGGAQAYFGVQADLVTYGKIVAGGLPMGVVAGRREVMDVFDGGVFNYGDDSYPAAQRTIFAGAFFKHPLSMAVACSVLEEIQRRGQPMYDALNERTTRLVARLNAFFEAGGYPVTTVQFSSSFRFFYGPEFQHPDLFNHHLVLNGVYMIPETGTHFLSTAHSDDDLETFFQAVRASAEAMRSGGFIPAGPDGGAGVDVAQAPVRIETGATADVSATSAAAVSAVTSAAASVADVRGDGVRVLPIGEGQRQLWVESQMGDDANRACVESGSIRLHGDFRVDAMRAALRAMVARHDALRTTFGAEGDTQLVHPAVEVEVPLEDFRAVPAAEREARLEEWVGDGVRRPFDLTAGPLFRFALAALGDDEHVLVFTFHHAVLDGWSAGVVTRELGELYAAARDGRPASLAPPADHAATVAAQIAGAQNVAADQAYWLEQFAGGIPVLDLPADRPRPPTRSYRGGRVTRVIGGEVVARLAEAGRPHGLNLFNLAFSACFVWLSKLAGEDDLVVGTPAAGQAGRAELRDLVGYGINLLPIRARVDGAATFLEHARGVRRALMRGLEHQGFSFPRLVDALLRARDASRPTLVAVGMFLDHARSDGSLGGLRTEFRDNFCGGSKVDLNLGLTETPRGLEVRCDYSADLFDPETIERWLGHFERLLAQVAERPETRIADLALIGPGERRLVTEEWNRTDALVADLRVHQRVEARAAEAPESVAVEAGEAEGGGETVTYGELNARANRLARHLTSLGVGPEARVAICLERGAGLIVSMLAVLKAGGAYVPLDAAHPAERLAFMLADSGAVALVTRGGLPAGLAVPPSVATVDLDAAAGEIGAEAADDLPNRADARDLAYLIYTSGSTGQPKGVAVEHGALANLCAWHVRSHQITPADRASQLLGPAFDASVMEIWPPLVGGARIQVVPDALRADPEGLRGWMVRAGTTLALVPPALTEMMLASPWPAETALRWLVTGGDRLKVRPAPELPFRISNSYGPTECTVAVSAGTVTPDEANDEGIGRPGDNSRAYLLDAAMQPLPIGVPGELCVGGAQVARGYLGRPALTAESFVPDPYSSLPGARLYRTGDRARWRAGGTLEFIGRVDAQVKIRGYRIEPGEIEAVLRRQPGVEDCAVVAREEGAGERRLVAYVAGGIGAPAVDELRAALRRALPEHMVPAAFVAMDRLPRASSGKLERGELPAPDYAAGAEHYAAPGTPVEQTLAEVWREVLGVARVGRNDGFFELGGHSMLMPRLQTRLREALGRTIPIVDLFRFATVASLAEHLAGEAGATPAPVVEGSERAARRRALAAERAGGAVNLAPHGAAA